MYINCMCELYSIHSFIYNSDWYVSDWWDGFGIVIAKTPLFRHCHLRILI